MGTQAGISQPPGLRMPLPSPGHSGWIWHTLHDHGVPEAWVRSWQEGVLLFLVRSTSRIVGEGLELTPQPNPSSVTPKHRLLFP